MVLKDLGEFLAKADGERAGFIEIGGMDAWVYALPTSKYTFHFSVHAKDGEVEKIEPREMDWIKKHVALFEYEAPPDFIKETVDERVELVEDPNAITILKDECLRCQEEYLADVTPKFDLLIDGLVGQRMVEEYCPECGQPLTQRTTYKPPKQYDTEFHNENAPPEHQFDPDELDISNFTWEHARR